MTDGHSNERYAVGDTRSEIVVEELQRKDFVRYAGASGDFNPIHYNEPYATEAGNPSVFGQGMCTAGYVASFAADWFGIGNIGRFRVRFLTRVWPGDSVTVSGEIVEISLEDDEVRVTAELTAENGDSDELVSGTVEATLPSQD